MLTWKGGGGGKPGERMDVWLDFSFELPWHGREGDLERWKVLQWLVGCGPNCSAATLRFFITSDCLSFSQLCKKVSLGLTFVVKSLKIEILVLAILLLPQQKRPIYVTW